MWHYSSPLPKAKRSACESAQRVNELQIKTGQGNEFSQHAERVVHKRLVVWKKSPESEVWFSL